MSPELQPQVSIVMSIHDASLTEVKNSCKSILSQTYQNMEFLIIDDVNSGTVCKYLSRLEDRQENVKIIRNLKNKGLTTSLRDGIRLATGKYIARQDADDLSAIKRIEKQVDFLEKNPAVCVVGSGYKLEDKINDKSTLVYPPCETTDIISAMFYINPFCHSSVMFRRDAYFIAGEYDPSFETSQDFDLWFRMARVGQLSNIKEILVTRRLTKSSLSMKFSKATQQIQNGLKIRIREKSFYTGRFFYLNSFFVYSRSLIILIIPNPLINLLKNKIFK